MRLHKLFRELLCLALMVTSYLIIRSERCQRGSICATFRDGHDFRFLVMLYGTREEAQSRCGIPFHGQQNVNSLIQPVYRSV